MINNLNMLVSAPNGDKYVGSYYFNGESLKGASATPDSRNPVECRIYKGTQGRYLQYKGHGSECPERAAEVFRGRLGRPEGIRCLPQKS